VFLILVADEYRTGDGTQAWVAQSDLVASPRELAHIEKTLLNALIERARLYKPLLEARSRFEAAAS
jgi:hypothetical protein